MAAPAFERNERERVHLQCETRDNEKSIGKSRIIVFFDVWHILEKLLQPVFKELGEIT